MEKRTRKSIPDAPGDPNGDGRSIGRREFLKLAGLAGITIAVGGGLGNLLAGCGGSTTSTAGNASTPTAAGGTTGVGANTTSSGSSVSVGSGGGKSIKIGMISDFSHALFVDWGKVMAAVIPALNASGGITVAGEKYQIDLISYDGKASAEASRSAAQRLISQDKVQFIMGDTSIDYWQPLVEAAKIVTCVGAPSQAILKPQNKYTFQSYGFNLTRPSVWSWYTQKYPDVKTVSAAFPDNMNGHNDEAALKLMTDFAGQTITKTVFYPVSTTDFSAISTALVNANADWFTTSGGGTVSDAQLLKAMKQGGYKGQVGQLTQVTLGGLSQVVSADSFEGMIGNIDGTEYPTLTPVTKEMMDLYTAKYGSWDYPSIGWAASWYLLKAALEKSPGIDSEAVRSTIAAGLEFDSPEGQVRMVSRPDFGNSSTVDALYAPKMGQVQQGKWQVVGDITLDEAYTYCKAFFKW